MNQEPDKITEATWALQSAVARRDVEETRRLVALPDGLTALNTPMQPNGFTILYSVTDDLHYGFDNLSARRKVFETLLEIGADPRVPSYEHELLPIHVALSRLSTSSLNTILSLQHGKDTVNSRIKLDSMHLKPGFTPLMLAVATYDQPSAKSFLLMEQL